MSKKLNESAMQDELSGSVFFQPKPVQQYDSSPPPKQGQIKAVETPKTHQIPKTSPTPISSKKSVPEKSKNTDINNNTMVPRHHDTTISNNQNTLIENIRKAVKKLGKEAATYRFTEEEKKALADIVYTYKTSGIKTSENEITRTAINFLVEDYRENGSNSILAQVLERLNE